MNFYNEFDSNAAAWLRGLIAAGLIPPGVVDERSITEIKPHELSGYTQCHFFAGIGGWSLALQLAGWPADKPVWTMSCPCQPFSDAGKGLAQLDERHLWPVAFNLIKECRPECVFGEQVAAAIGKGWLDGISADLEGEGYACGAVVLGAHSVGADHHRQRLYWVADAECEQREGMLSRSGDDRGEERSGETAKPSGHRSSRGLADSELHPRCSELGDQSGRRESPGPEHAGKRGRDHGRLANSERTGLQGHAGNGGDGSEPGRIDADAVGSTSAGGSALRVAYAYELDDDRAGSRPSDDRGERRERELSGVEAPSERLGDTNSDGRQPGESSAEATGHGDSAEPAGFWDDSYWILCRDGKHRRIPTEPALFPLADGLPYKLARRGSVRPALLKGAGNAIVPEVAAEFIISFIEVTPKHQHHGTSPIIR